MHDSHVHEERGATSQTRKERKQVCAGLTGRLALAYNESEYLLVALGRETRFGFVKALSNKRSETIKDAMVNMQLLLREVGRFHSDEGREFMGAVDDWLREHAVLHTTTGAYDPNANSFAEENVASDVSCIKRTHLCLWPDAAEHANEVYNHSKRPVPGQNDMVEPIVLERRAFFGTSRM